jgi:phosphoribosylcarboxyaminoimidazole (NCAIR) mutase
MAVVGSGVKSAGLLAAQILAVGGGRLQEALAGFQQKLAEESARKIKTSKSDAARGLISGQRVIGEFTP